MFGIAHKATAGFLLLSTVLMFSGCTGTLTIHFDLTIENATGASTPLHHKALIDPPGSDLALLDTTQALLTLSVTNGTISSTSGTATLSVIDHTNGQTVGQQDFGYVVNGNSLYAQDPTGVHNWLSQFTSYADVDVQVDVTPVITAISPGTVSSTSSIVYQGTTYASATATWSYGGGGGGGTCHTRFCPNQ